MPLVTKKNRALCNLFFVRVTPWIVFVRCARLATAASARSASRVSPRARTAVAIKSSKNRDDEMGVPTDVVREILFLAHLMGRNAVLTMHDVFHVDGALHITLQGMQRNPIPGDSASRSLCARRRVRCCDS